MGNITYYLINGVKAADIRTLLTEFTCAKETKYSLVTVNERPRNHAWAGFVEKIAKLKALRKFVKASRHCTVEN